MGGPDPAHWEFTGMSYDPQPGETYQVIYSRDPITDEEEIRYEKQLASGEDPVEFYCTTGNHNGWTEDRMIEGDVPGLFYQIVEVPNAGVLEFRILAEGDSKRAIGPESSTY